MYQSRSEEHLEVFYFRPLKAATDQDEHVKNILTDTIVFLLPSARRLCDSWRLPVCLMV